MVVEEGDQWDFEVKETELDQLMTWLKSMTWKIDEVA
jgi:hypothetical protein